MVAQRETTKSKQEKKTKGVGEAELISLVQKQEYKWLNQNQSRHLSCHDNSVVPTRRPLGLSQVPLDGQH